MLRRPVIPLISLALACVALSGCASSAMSPTSATSDDRKASAADAGSSVDCAGVWLEVDFDILGADIITTCIDAPAPVDALAVLETADVTVEGTADYGLAVVCRVTGMPAADQALKIPGHETYRETCAAMTPEFGYWSVWVENRATGAWEYAPVGIDSLTLKAGESLGCTFTTGTHTDPPIDPLAP